MNSTTVVVLRGGVGDSVAGEDGRGDEDLSPPPPSAEDDVFSLPFVFAKKLDPPLKQGWERIMIFCQKFKINLFC